jgi:HPt (histidine-containing phosphotransfer) domain-containing protein
VDKEEKTAEAIFDYDCLVGRLMGDTEFVRKVLDIFIDDIPKLLNTLKMHNLNNDTKNVEIVAHTIKGAASNVCLEQLRVVAGKIEADCRKGDLVHASQALTELETCIVNAVSEIQKKING